VRLNLPLASAAKSEDGNTASTWQVARHFGISQEIVNRRRREDEIPYKVIEQGGRREYRYNIEELERDYMHVLSPRKRGPKTTLP
jgi:hypothetical protein